MLLVEMFLIVIALLLAFLTPRTGSDFFSRIENRFAWLAKRRKLAVLTVGAAALGIRLALLPINPLPLPAVHDEFSYLLAGDTFAHGKLANPTHPMWIHFETFHVNQRPSYVSMYYPAQGLFLAAGQVLFGHPYWGVWLSTGLMCAAICWMLQGWFPPVWALLGGCLAVIRLGTFSYWMNSYWGGSVAALGGALVLGALPRIKRHQRPIDAVLMGLGFALLANSRPYEGLFFSVPILGAIVIWMFGRKAPSIRIVVIRIVAPLLLLFAATLVFMGYYFWRTTGSPFRTPYSVNAAIYRPVPLFPWQGVTNIPKYRNIEMRNFYGGWVTEQYDFARSHPILLLLTKAWATWSFYFGPLLTLPFFAACFVLPYGLTFQQLSTRAKLMLVVCGFVFLGAALPVCYDAHYLAPLSCVFYALVVMAMQKVRNWMPRGKTSGRAIVRSTACLSRASRPAIRWTTARPEMPQMLAAPRVSRSARSAAAAQETSASQGARAGAVV